MKRISEMTKWEKFNEVKKYQGWDEERPVLAKYLKAIWLNDIETQRYFERFGDDIRVIVMNSIHYERAKLYGLEQLDFDTYGWLNFHLEKVEKVNLDKWNYIEIAKGPNEKHTYGLSYSTGRTGGGFNSDVWNQPYATFQDALIGGFEELEGIYRQYLDKCYKEEKKILLQLIKILSVKKAEYLHKQLTLNFD